MLTSVLLHAPIGVGYGVVGLTHIGVQHVRAVPVRPPAREPDRRGPHGRPLRAVRPRRLRRGALREPVRRHECRTPASTAPPGRCSAILGATAVIQRRLGIDTRYLYVLILINFALAFFLARHRLAGARRRADRRGAHRLGVLGEPRSAAAQPCPADRRGHRRGARRARAAPRGGAGSSPPDGSASPVRPRSYPQVCPQCGRNHRAGIRPSSGGRSRLAAPSFRASAGTWASTKPWSCRSRTAARRSTASTAKAAPAEALGHVVRVVQVRVHRGLRAVAAQDAPRAARRPGTPAADGRPAAAPGGARRRTGPERSGARCG